PKAAEPPKAEAPKVIEAPKAEVPKAEAPKIETPKTETPRAPEAPKAERPRIIKPKSNDVPPAIAAAVKPGSIVTRHGDHGTFLRLAIDWPSKIGYQVSRDGDRIEIAFTPPGHIDLTR